MNRLFILGNGFDLNLGLPTSYKYFYRYYYAQNSLSENIVKLKDNIRQYEDKDWKDLELGLGKYTQKLDDYETLEEVYTDLNICLSDYLSIIDKFKYPYGEKLIDKINKDIARPEVYLTKAEQNVLNKFAAGLQSNSDNNVVTFNYTHTLENLLGQDRNVAKTILHIHRELGDNGVLLGVDNSGQIVNEVFQRNEAVSNILVKPMTNRSLGTLNDESFSSLINNANLICFFGVSLGETDLTWWKKIGYHMLNTDKCRVIYFVKTSKKFIIDQLRLNYKSECKKHFINALQIDKKYDTTGILSRIDVVLNSSIFKDDTLSNDLEKMYRLIFEKKLS